MCPTVVMTIALMCAYTSEIDQKFSIHFGVPSMNEIIYAEGHPLAMREEKFALNSDFACSVFQSNEQFPCVRAKTFLSHLKELGTGPCLYLSRLF